jgi:hypothetical protein
MWMFGYNFSNPATPIWPLGTQLQSVMVVTPEALAMAEVRLDTVIDIVSAPQTVSIRVNLPFDFTIVSPFVVSC